MNSDRWETEADEEGWPRCTAEYEAVDGQGTVEALVMRGDECANG